MPLFFFPWSIKLKYAKQLITYTREPKLEITSMQIIIFQVSNKNWRSNPHQRLHHCRVANRNQGNWNSGQNYTYKPKLEEI